MYTQWIIHLIHKWSIERFKDGCCLSISVSTKLLTCHWRLYPTISIRSHSTCKTDTYMHRNIKMYRLINGYHWSTYITLQSRNTSMFPLFMVHGDEYRKYDDSLNYTSIAGFMGNFLWLHSLNTTHIIYMDVYIANLSRHANLINGIQI